MVNMIYVEILVILILVTLNGILAMSEIAIISARKIKLQKMSEDGNKGAEIALELADSPNQFLSTIQIGITLIGILAGAFGGATIAQKLEIYLNQFSFLSQYSGFISVFVVVLIITYLSLIIGELVPKRIAIDNPERIAVKMAKPMKILSKITRPVVYFLSASMDILLRILRVNEPDEKLVTEDEVMLLIEEGRKTGEFEKDEEEMINRVFELDQRRINAIMTPKTNITWLDINESEDDIFKKIFQSKHSIFPVSEGFLDNFLGVVQVKDFVNTFSTVDKLDLKKFIKKPLIVPESSYALDVLKQFKTSAEDVHIAIIVDEYGDIEGLITLYDILEAIVGDLPSTEDLKVVKRSENSWLIDGLINIDEFKSIFKIEELPNEDTSNYQTLAGFIITYLGKIPVTGDKFLWNGFSFEIVDMDGYHIDKVIVTHLE